MEATLDFINHRKYLLEPGVNFENVILTTLKYGNFAYQLMYLKYADKQKITDFINEHNIYQNANYTPENIEYLNNLPTNLINFSTLDNESIEMLNILKWKQEYIEYNEFELMHDYVLKYLNIKYPQYKVNFI